MVNWHPRCNTALSDFEVKHDDINGSLWHSAPPAQIDFWPGVGEAFSLLVAIRTAARSSLHQINELQNAAA
jgi:hypothetical protein